MLMSERLKEVNRLLTENSEEMSGLDLDAFRIGAKKDHLAERRQELFMEKYDLERRIDRAKSDVRNMGTRESA